MVLEEGGIWGKEGIQQGYDAIETKLQLLPEPLMSLVWKSIKILGELQVPP